jgi:hypothetical protein
MAKDAAYWRSYRARRRAAGKPVGHVRNLARHPQRVAAGLRHAAPTPHPRPQPAPTTEPQPPARDLRSMRVGTRPPAALAPKRSVLVIGGVKFPDPNPYIDRAAGRTVRWVDRRERKSPPEPPKPRRTTEEPSEEPQSPSRPVPDDSEEELEEIELEELEELEPVP